MSKGFRGGSRDYEVTGIEHQILRDDGDPDGGSRAGAVRVVEQRLHLRIVDDVLTRCLVGLANEEVGRREMPRAVVGETGEQAAVEPDQILVRIEIGDGIDSVTDDEDVEARTSDQVVVARAAGQGVLAAAGLQPVVTPFSEQLVVAGAAVDDVVGRAAGEGVEAAHAGDLQRDRLASAVGNIAAAAAADDELLDRVAG